jgi:hypothetical protein
MIGETSTLMVGPKHCQAGVYAPMAKLASKFLGEIFREQLVYEWCLRCRLFGNGPRALATPIPAPGGEQ